MNEYCLYVLTLITCYKLIQYYNYIIFIMLTELVFETCLLEHTQVAKLPIQHAVLHWSIRLKFLNITVFKRID